MMRTLPEDRFIRAWDYATSSWREWVGIKSAIQKSPWAVAIKSKYRHDVEHLGKMAAALVGEHPHGVVGPSRVAKGE